jgi:hypothetical protein
LEFKLEVTVTFIVFLSIDVLAILSPIGNNVTITYSTLIAHDASTQVPYSFIILGNTSIGNKVIIGVGSVVCKNIPENSVVCGNPVRIICTYDEYIKKNKNLLQTSPVSNILFSQKLSKDKEEQAGLLLNKWGYYLLSTRYQ